MDALEALHSRVSTPRLSGPAPDDECLHNIFKAAFRAADHALLRPWRFLVVRDESLEKLGDLFVSASLADNPDLSQDKLQSIRSKALRAPVIVITISSPKEHPGVPLIEQELSAGAATQNMLLAAHAQAVGAIWRTGPMAFSRQVMQGLGLNDHEKIISFLYLGQSQGPVKEAPALSVDEFFKPW